MLAAFDDANNDVAPLAASFISPLNKKDGTLAGRML